MHMCVCVYIYIYIYVLYVCIHVCLRAFAFMSAIRHTLGLFICHIHTASGTIRESFMWIKLTCMPNACQTHISDHAIFSVHHTCTCTHTYPHMHIFIHTYTQVRCDHNIFSEFPAVVCLGDAGTIVSISTHRLYV